MKQNWCPLFPGAALESGTHARACAGQPKEGPLVRRGAAPRLSLEGCLGFTPAAGRHLPQHPVFIQITGNFPRRRVSLLR